MASEYGENRGMRCLGCGMRYDDFRTGMSFIQVRRDIIAIQTDTATGKTKYGRRNGVLGYWHELKMMLWDQHVGECEFAADGTPHVMLAAIVSDRVTNTRREKRCATGTDTAGSNTKSRSRSSARSTASSKSPPKNLKKRERAKQRSPWAR